jgi:hypothetical protein
MDELSETFSSEFTRIFDYGPVNESKRVIASGVMCSVVLGNSLSL